MKLQLPKEYWKDWGPLPSIYYKAEPTLGKTLTEKSNSLKVNTETQPGERDSKTVEIYLPLFWTGSPESILNFVTILNKIIRGQELSTGSQKFVMKRNLVIGEVLRVFDQKVQERGTETKETCELAMKDLDSHFFLPKALQRQKWYLRRGLYKLVTPRFRIAFVALKIWLSTLRSSLPLGRDNAYQKMRSLSWCSSHS